VRPLAKLPRAFYRRPTLAVARDLPGKLLVRKIKDRFLVGRIVEVEAYLGNRDPASHAFRGMTTRNEVMFGDGGTLYVYFTYGMHYCCNVVTGRKGMARAVLVRAVEPLEGIDVMTTLRAHPGKPAPKILDLCSGPGKTCAAFGIGRGENGTDLLGDAIWLARDPAVKDPPRLERSPRIGVSNGRDRLWRFSCKADPFVSRPRPSPLPRKRQGR